MDRIDTIIVWGHGIKYLDKILEYTNEKFEILKIKRYKIKNVKKFIKDVYSFDYAPFWHLKDKTKYLLNVPKEAVFIFIKNLNPNEDYFGEGKFRHRESKTLKNFKEFLRDKFNPYENNKRTHNHIIHATDNPTQTHCLLKMLGYKEGIKIFEEDKFIKLPYYLKGYKKFEIKKIDINSLYGNIVVGKSWDNFDLELTPLSKTPHFLGIKNIEVYQNYIDKFLGGPLGDYYNKNKYQNLIQNFKYLKDEYKNNYVIVKQNKDRFVILDGLHRASILYSQGYKEIIVCQVL